MKMNCNFSINAFVLLSFSFAHPIVDQAIKDLVKPFLSTSYKFPLKKQSLNGCYFFSVRNIIKHKYGVGVYISHILKHIGFDEKTISG